VQLRGAVRRLQALQQLRVVRVQREVVLLARVLVSARLGSNAQLHHGTCP
jgi:hypothetical protein